MRADDQTAGGLYIPEAAKEQPLECDVIAVGQDVATIDPGDRVLIGRFSGIEVELDGDELVIVRADEVLVKLKEK